MEEASPGASVAPGRGICGGVTARVAPGRLGGCPARELAAARIQCSVAYLYLPANIHATGRQRATRIPAARTIRAKNTDTRMTSVPPFVRTIDMGRLSPYCGCTAHIWRGTPHLRSGVAGQGVHDGKDTRLIRLMGWHDQLVPGAPHRLHRHSRPRRAATGSGVTRLPGREDRQGTWVSTVEEGRLDQLRAPWSVDLAIQRWTVRGCTPIWAAVRRSASKRSTSSAATRYPAAVEIACSRPVATQRETACRLTPAARATSRSDIQRVSVPFDGRRMCRITSGRSAEFDDS